MSVTLKLADQDADLIQRVLKTVAGLQQAFLRKEETVHFMRQLEREISSAMMVDHVLELAGAFKVAVRANER